MTQGVAGKSVKRKKEDIDRQDDRANPDAEMAVEEERTNGVVPKKNDEQNREIEKIAMDILQDKGKRGLAAILAAREFANRAGRGIKKESSVIGFAIVVARSTKAERPGEDQERGRQFPPAVFRIDE